MTVAPWRRDPRPFLPCTDPDCVDRLGGFVNHGSTKPVRMSGRIFGIDGVLCKRCYSRHQKQRQRELAPRQVRRPTSWAPKIRLPGRPKAILRPPDPAAVATIAALHAQQAEYEAAGEPRRPCPANPRGGHRLVQPPGDGPMAPFVCADCGYRWVAPARFWKDGARWPGTKGRSAAELRA